MSEVRLKSVDSTAAAPRTARTAPVVTGPEIKIGGDHASFSQLSRTGQIEHANHTGPIDDPHGDAGHHDTSVIEEIAHTAHNPHGALHAVEAGEHAVKTAARFAGRAGRAAAVAGEVVHAPGQGHHGLLGKFEKFVENGLDSAGKFIGNGLRRLPGGGKALDGLNKALGAPGRLMGPGLDKALAGTRVGSAVKFTGAGAGFLSRMGGRIPVLGAFLGGVIAVTDYRSSMAIIKDPKATTKEKVIAGSQGGLSVISGVAGVGAMGIAAAAAIGFTAPVSVPLLLGVAAVTGIVSFGLSFFKKH